MSSYGDFVALSDVCDVQTAKMLAREVSDGVIAPGYTDEALEVLKTKRKGTYNIIKIDPDYKPALTETKEVFGITFEQDRNEAKITAELLENRPTKNKEIPENAQRDLLIALITLKYTLKTARQSASAQASSPAYTARALQATKPISGGCARTRKFWHCRLKKTSAARTATTPLTCIFPTITRMYWQTAYGKTSLPKSRSL